jgi:hypothetical protein
MIDDMRGWTWDPFITPAALDLLTVQSPHYNNSPPTRDGAPLGIAFGLIPCFLPFLEQLTIRGNCFLSPDGTIADMAESRWRYCGDGVSRLKRIEVELPTNHINDVRRLKELQGEGLEVVLLQQY